MSTVPIFTPSILIPYFICSASPALPWKEHGKLIMLGTVVTDVICVDSTNLKTLIKFGAQNSAKRHNISECAQWAHKYFKS